MNVVAAKTLEDKINVCGSAAEMLRSNPGGRFSFPIAPEFTNWRDEQRAWRETVALQDMSFHMTEVHIEGPDVIEFISHIGANGFANFDRMQAKQLVLCNDDGYLIGDTVLIREDSDTELYVIGRPESAIWVQFQAETSDYDVEVSKVEFPTPNLAERSNYRYQVQGPKALDLLEALNGGPLPEIRFFKMGRFNIGSYEVIALNHRMSGFPGFEFWGPSSEGDSVKALILEEGENYGLRQIGGRVYSTSATESGWLGGPVPAIYTGEATKSYRQWLGADSHAANASIGGSFTFDDLEETYVTPYDIGYGFAIKFDHEFIGREQLEKVVEKQPRRKKVRLVWDADSVLDIAGSLLRDQEPYKYMEVPMAGYATYCFDEVREGDTRVGMSSYPVYSATAVAWISLAIIDEEFAADGKELTLTWGEPDGGSAKPAVEPHRQKTVKVTVDSQPIKRSHVQQYSSQSSSI